MHEIDRVVKVISGRHPDCFLDLFYGCDRTINLIGVEDTQLQIPEHRADKIWRVQEDEQEGIILLEAILQPDKRDFRRINLKNAAVQVAMKIPVVTVLVYLQQGEYRTFPGSYEQRLGGLSNRHSFARILLWEHEDRIRSGELKELAPFLPLFYDDPPIAILEETNELIESLENEQERVELKAVATIIGVRKFAEELVKQILKLEYAMIREKTIFTEWFEQERAEGKTEGKTEGKHLLLLKQLEKKFGPISPEMKNALQKLGSDESDELGLALFDLQTVEDLKGWLYKNGSNTFSKR
ncbi:MAG: DUF4351 domain-containing protein [bacterium]